MATIARDYSRSLISQAMLDKTCQLQMVFEAARAILKISVARSDYQVSISLFARLSETCICSLQVASDLGSYDCVHEMR